VNDLRFVWKDTQLFSPRKTHLSRPLDKSPRPLTRQECFMPHRQS
jgi:hypothetical protein